MLTNDVMLYAMRKKHTHTPNKSALSSSENQWQFEHKFTQINAHTGVT